MGERRFKKHKDTQAPKEIAQVKHIDTIFAADDLAAKHAVELKLLLRLPLAF